MVKGEGNLSKIYIYIARVDVIDGDELGEVFAKKMTGNTPKEEKQTLLVDYNYDASFHRQSVIKVLPALTNLLGSVCKSNRVTYKEFICLSSTNGDHWTLIIRFNC